MSAAGGVGPPETRYARLGGDRLAYQVLGQGPPHLVSRTVHDLVAGSDLALADRGSHRPKGVDGDWQLFAISPEPDRR